MRFLILCVLIATPSLTSAIELSPAAVGTAMYDNFYTSEFRSNYAPLGGQNRNGAVEFDLQGLQVPVATQATLTLIFDEFKYANSIPNEGSVPMRIEYTEGDGVIDQNDFDFNIWGMSYFVDSPGGIILLDVTSWVIAALENEWDYISFRTGVYGSFVEHGVWVAAYDSLQSGSDGILANNFKLSVIPEPTTLSLLALGSLAVMQRRKRSAL